MWLPKRLMGLEAVLIEALSYNKGKMGQLHLKLHTQHLEGEVSPVGPMWACLQGTVIRQ